MGVVIDSYPETHWSNQWTQLGYPPAAAGQSFTGNGQTLGSAAFFLNKLGVPDGTVVAKIYAHSGTYGTSSVPTGSALATSVTRDPTLFSTGFQVIPFEFTGGNQIVLSAATPYVLTVEYSIAGDFSKWVGAGYDSAGPSHDGNYSDKNPTWVADSAADLIFYVYDNTPDPYLPAAIDKPVRTVRAR